VRRINIYIDEELDQRAEREARRRRTSKAALVRQGLVLVLGASTGKDAVDDIVGLSEAEPVENIDDIIYGA
jgi:uncharacterized protein (DUF58 family)